MATAFSLLDQSEDVFYGYAKWHLMSCNNVNYSQVINQAFLCTERVVSLRSSHPYHSWNFSCWFLCELWTLFLSIKLRLNNQKSMTWFRYSCHNHFSWSEQQCCDNFIVSNNRMEAHNDRMKSPGAIFCVPSILGNRLILSFGNFFTRFWRKKFEYNGTVFDFHLKNLSNNNIA